jgi:hypothetical protein
MDREQISRRHGFRRVAFLAVSNEAQILVPASLNTGHNTDREMLAQRPVEFPLAMSEEPREFACRRARCDYEIRRLSIHPDGDICSERTIEGIGR